MPAPKKIEWSKFSGIDRITTPKKINEKLFATENFYSRKPGTLSKRQGSEYFTEKNDRIAEIKGNYTFYRENFGAFNLAWAKMNKIENTDVPQFLSAQAHASTGTTVGSIPKGPVYTLTCTKVGSGGETMPMEVAEVDTSGVATDSCYITCNFYPGEVTSEVPINMYIDGLYCGTFNTDTFNVTILPVELTDDHTTLNPGIAEIIKPRFDSTKFVDGLPRGAYYYCWSVAVVNDVTPSNIFASEIKTFYINEDGSKVRFRKPRMYQDITTVGPIGFNSAYLMLGTSPSLLRIVATVPLIDDPSPSAWYYFDYNSLQEYAINKVLHVNYESGVRQYTPNKKIAPSFTSGETGEAQQEFVDIQEYLREPIENSTGTDSLLVFSESGKLQREIISDAYYKRDGNRLEIGKGYQDKTTSSIPCFCTCLDRCFIGTNDNAILKTDGYTMQPIGPFNDGFADPTRTNSLYLNPKFITSFNNSIIAGGGNLGDDFFYFSIPGDPDFFTRDRLATQLNAVLISTDRGDRISGLGTASNNTTNEGPGVSLLISKTRSLSVLSVLPMVPGMAAPRRTIEKLDGCCSHRSIVNTPSGTIYCGRTSVWIVSGQGDVQEIGGPISNVITRIPPSIKERIFAVLDDVFYKLYIPSFGSTVPDMQYWFDIRRITLNAEPTEVCWYGPMTGQVLHNATSRDGQIHYNDVLAIDESKKRLKLIDVIASSTNSYPQRHRFSFNTNGNILSLSNIDSEFITLGDAIKQDYAIDFSAFPETSRITYTGHKFIDGQRVQLKNIIAPSPFLPNTDYYVKVVDEDSFSLSTELHGDPIVFSDPVKMDIDLLLGSNNVMVEVASNLSTGTFVRIYDNTNALIYDCMVDRVISDNVLRLNKAISALTGATIKYFYDIDLQVGYSLKPESFSISANTELGEYNCNITYRDTNFRQHTDGYPSENLSYQTGSKLVLTDSDRYPKYSNKEYVVTDAHIYLDAQNNYQYVLVLESPTAIPNPFFDAEMSNIETYEVSNTITAINSISEIYMDGSYGRDFTDSNMYMTRNISLMRDSNMDYDNNILTRTDITSKIKTGDLDCGESRVNKRCFSVYASCMGEDNSEIEVRLIKNKEEEERNGATIIPVPSTANKWTEDMWNNETISGNLGLKVRLSYFKGVQLFNTGSFEIIHSGNSDMLITDFGINFDFERRLVV